MNAWSEIARLGAFVAVFGLPVAAQADEEPEQVELATLALGNQSVAAMQQAIEPDVDPYPWMDAFVAGKVAPLGNFAAMPEDTTITTPPTIQRELRRDLRQNNAKPRSGARPAGGGWSGAGQRYG